ncbi:signal peptidase I [Ureibacillus xyleni]|uniref:Signal peptidase I n=1 Tax=Ureibacillus xyleni TaxID=614648 RepID=A0A285SJ54_9BACL|nr:signal peptidase I [Ureibacillus xyleni]SOC05959.1 signal peptidase I [Ureibacillus xyleni]
MEQKTEKNELIEWVKAIIIGVIIAWAVPFFLFMPTQVQGASMMPTFEDGDKVVVNKIGPKLTEYNRFDVIVFKATETDNYIKRIIGLPGDKIAYKDDVLYINGEKFDEPYLEDFKNELIDSGTLTQDFALEEILNESVVPEGHFFVLGDNRRYSRDSRDPNLGFISQERVLGTVDVRVWPLNHLGLIH